MFAFAAAQRVDLVALGAHNLTAATLEGNATNAWGAPTFSAALTIPPRQRTASPATPGCDLTAVAGYSAAGFQFWRLVVSGASPCAVGEVWLGAMTRLLERAYQRDFGLGETHATIAHLTEFLVPHVYALGSRQRRMRATFRAMRPARWRCASGIAR